MSVGTENQWEARANVTKIKPILGVVIGQGERCSNASDLGLGLLFPREHALKLKSLKQT